MNEGYIRDRKERLTTMIENQIEFNKVKEIWSGLATTGKAKEQIKQQWIILDESILRKEIKDTTDARELIEKLGNPPLQNVTEMKEIMQIAQRGDCLSPYQLERVEKVLVVTEDNLREVAFKSVSVFFGIHPKSVSSESLCAYLQSPEGQAEIEKHLTGTTMRTLCLVQANQIDVKVE